MIVLECNITIEDSDKLDDLAINCDMEKEVSVEQMEKMSFIGKLRLFGISSTYHNDEIIIYNFNDVEKLYLILCIAKESIVSIENCLCYNYKKISRIYMNENGVHLYSTDISNLGEKK